jgi:hypothetical protein
MNCPTREPLARRPATVFTSPRFDVERLQLLSRVSRGEGRAALAGGPRSGLHAVQLINDLLRCQRRPQACEQRLKVMEQLLAER